MPKNKAAASKPTTSEVRIPTSVLQLPEGMKATTVEVDGDTLVVTATPAGKNLSGSVNQFRAGGKDAFRVEYVAAPEETEE